MEHKVEKKRHIAKTITWRMLGTLDTMLIAWLVTGSITMGAAIGGIEVITKMFLYYGHERVWYKYIKFGIKGDNV
jgi:uncharacterized membrane protein